MVREARRGFCDWVCGEKWFWILFDLFFCRVCGHEARMPRRGLAIRCGMVLDFGLVWGVLSAFVAREARRGVCDSGFVVENGPQPWPWPLIIKAYY